MITLQRATLLFPLLRVVLLIAALFGVRYERASADNPAVATQRSPAQSALPPEIAASLSKTTASLTEAGEALQQLSGFEDELGSLRTKVEDVLDQTSQTAEGASPPARGREVADREAGCSSGKRCPARGPGGSHLSALAWPPCRAPTTARSSPAK